MTFVTTSDDRRFSVLISAPQAPLFASLFSGRAADDGRLPSVDMVVAHLRGESRLSVLPAFEDDTTAFVVLAFRARTGRGWKTDATQVSVSAARLGVPLYLERVDVPGGGIDAWIFFSEPVPVIDARRIAGRLLYDASVGDPDVIKSLERVLPARSGETGQEQSVVLPLSGLSRARGQSVFVQAQRGLPAVPDQWALLFSVSRLGKRDVSRILGGTPGGEEGGPREMQPGEAGRARVALSASLAIRRPLPRVIARRLRERLVVANPAFVHRKREGRSTRNVARQLVGCVRRAEAWLLPRALEPELRVWCEEANVPYELSDMRCRHSDRVHPRPAGLLPDHRALLDQVLPMEFAMIRDKDELTRTIVALGAVAERGQPTVLLTTNRSRVQQWREQALLAGFAEEDVAGLSDVGPRPHPFLVVGTFAEVHGHAERLDGPFGHLVLDECSRAPLEPLLMTARSVPAWFVLGLHDDVPRADGLDALVELHVGRAVTSSHAGQENVLDVVIRTTCFHYQEAISTDVETVPSEDALNVPPDELFKMPRPLRAPAASASPPARSREWNLLLDALARDLPRNELVAHDVVAEAREHHPCLVLTARREHATMLATLVGRDVRVATAIGSMPIGRRREAVRQFHDGEVEVLVVTEQLMGAGFDASNVARLFLALPLKVDGQLRQMLTVLSRAAIGERLVRVYDYVDEQVSRLRNMAQTRRRYYRKTMTTLNPDAMQLQLPFG